MNLRLPLLAGILALSSVATASAAPAVVYDLGGKFDKSFNEAAYRGAERWKKETGQTYLDFEIANATQREQAMQRMAARGADPSSASASRRARRWRRRPRPSPS